MVGNLISLDERARRVGEGLVSISRTRGKERARRLSRMCVNDNLPLLRRAVKPSALGEILQLENGF